MRKHELMLAAATVMLAASAPVVAGSPVSMPPRPTKPPKPRQPSAHTADPAAEERRAWNAAVDAKKAAKRARTRGVPVAGKEADRG